jgi:RHS repeat-associated protein
MCAVGWRGAGLLVILALLPGTRDVAAQTWEPLPLTQTVTSPAGEVITFTLTGVKALYADPAQGGTYFVLPESAGTTITLQASWRPSRGNACAGYYWINDLTVSASHAGSSKERVIAPPDPPCRWVNEDWAAPGALQTALSFPATHWPFGVRLLGWNSGTDEAMTVGIGFVVLGPDLSTLGRPEDHPFAEFDEQDLSCSTVGMPGYAVHLGTRGLSVSDTELAYGSLGPRVAATRTYNAIPLQHQPVGAFGAGWTLDYESTLTVVADGVVLRRGSGAVDPYDSPGLAANGVLPAADVRLVSPEGRRDRLTWRGSQGDFLLDDLSTHERRRYTRVSDRADLFRLVAVLDANGNAVQLGFDSLAAAGRLTTIADAVGRTTTLTYGGPGQPVATLSAPDGRQATFSYQQACANVPGTPVCAPLLATTRDFLGTLTSYTYDEGGYLTRIASGGKIVSIAWATSGNPGGVQYASAVVDPSGGTTRYAWGGGGATEVTRPSGDVETYLHNGNLLTSSIDAWGRRITYEYTGGLPTKIDDAGAVTTRTYDADRNLVTETDPAGRVTRWTWDADAFLTSLTTPDGAVWSYAYDARHNLTVVTSPLSRTWRAEYDGRGLPIAAVDPLDRRRTFAHDSQGNLVSVADRTGRITTFTYDAMGRQSSIRPAGVAPGTRFDYDANDRPVTRTAADGSLRRFTYDACTPTAAVDELGARTRIVWDGGLRPLEVTDAVGQRWRTTYDADGLPLAYVDPLGRATGLAYGKTSASGSVRITEPTRATWWLTLGPRRALQALEGPERGGTRPRTRFTRNAADEVVSVEDPLGRIVAYTRDALGRAATTTNARGGRVDDTFDAEGRLTARQHGDTRVARFAYDAAGALVESEALTLGTTSYARDAEGRLLTIGYPNGATVRMTYDARGNRSTLTYPSGLVVTYAYDAVDRVSRVSWPGVGVDVQRDATGRVTRLVRSNGVASSFTRDALGRVDRLAHLAPGGIVADLTIVRDAAGNVVRVHGTEPHPRGFTAGTMAAAYDVADQIVTYNGAAHLYDADGNLERTTGATAWMARYDPENRLVSLSRTGQPAVSFAYDEFGRRARRVEGGVAVECQRDEDGSLLSETDAGGTVGAEYVHLDGRLIAMRRDGQSLFYLFDHLGSTLAVTDAAGALVAAYGYDVTGRVTGRTGTLQQPFTYVGAYGVEDDGAGLYLMGRRHYDAATGRFVQRDPIGLAGGMNLYEYAGGNPVRYVDPDGTYLMRPEYHDELLVQTHLLALPNNGGMSEKNLEALCGWATWVTDKVMDFTPVKTAYKVVKFPVTVYYKGLHDAAWDLLPFNMSDVRDLVKWSGVDEAVRAGASRLQERVTDWGVETFGPALLTTEDLLRAFQKLPR